MICPLTEDATSTDAAWGGNAVRLSVSGDDREWIELAADAAYLVVPMLLAVVLWRRWTREKSAAGETRARKGDR